MGIQKLDTAGERKHILRPLAIEGGIMQDVEILARQLLMAAHQFGLGKTLQHSAALIAIGNELLKLEGISARSIHQAQMEEEVTLHADIDGVIQLAIRSHKLAHSLIKMYGQQADSLIKM